MAKNPYITVETHPDGRTEVIDHASKKAAVAHGMARRRAGSADVFAHSYADAQKHGLDPRTKHIDRPFRPKESPVAAKKKSDPRAKVGNTNPYAASNQRPAKAAKASSKPAKKQPYQMSKPELYASATKAAAGGVSALKTRKAGIAASTGLKGANLAEAHKLADDGIKKESSKFQSARRALNKSVNGGLGSRQSLNAGGLRVGQLARSKFGKGEVAGARGRQELARTVGTHTPDGVTAPAKHQAKVRSARRSREAAQGKYQPKSTLSMPTAPKSTGNVHVGSNGKLQLNRPKGFEKSAKAIANAGMQGKAKIAGPSLKGALNTHTINKSGGGSSGMAVLPRQSSLRAKTGIKSLRSSGTRTHAAPGSTDAVGFDRNRQANYQGRAAAKTAKKVKEFQRKAQMHEPASLAAANRHHSIMNHARLQTHKAQGAKVANAGFKVGKKGGRYVLTDGGKKRYL